MDIRYNPVPPLNQSIGIDGMKNGHIYSLDT